VEAINKSFEETLIKHADTVQYLRIGWQPITRILSYLVNLLSLEINISHLIIQNRLNCLENLSLPILKILRTKQVPSKILVNLIESTKEHLTEISIFYDGVDSERLIQAIYQNCPFLKYLELSLTSNANSFISEF